MRGFLGTLCAVRARSGGGRLAWNYVRQERIPRLKNSRLGFIPAACDQREEVRVGRVVGALRSGI